jgi:hypothetical protein
MMWRGNQVAQKGDPLSPVVQEHHLMALSVAVRYLYRPGA